MVDNTMLMDLMDAYLTECEIRKLAPKTIEGYKKLLRAMLLWLSDNEQVDRLSDLTPMHFKRYLLHKEKDGASPQYINDILRVMRTFSRFLYDEGHRPKLLTEKNQKREAAEGQDCLLHRRRNSMHQSSLYAKRSDKGFQIQRFVVVRQELAPGQK